MYTLVSDQVAVMREGCPTNIADIGLLSRMEAFVPAQVAALCEGRPTFLAAMRFIT